MYTRFIYSAAEAANISKAINYDLEVLHMHCAAVSGNWINYVSGPAAIMMPMQHCLRTADMQLITRKSNAGAAARLLLVSSVHLTHSSPFKSQ